LNCDRGRSVFIKLVADFSHGHAVGDREPTQDAAA
jgi:hypothetical protein